MASVNERVQKHRHARRLSGMRQVQIWVPDNRRADFAEECSRQCRVIAESDLANRAIVDLMDEALDDIDGWTD